jgi:single stranded DNA-binding protein
MRAAHISGRLGLDPELFTPSGDTPWRSLTFSIANDDEREKKQDGSYENVTSWLDIVFWTKKPQHWLQKLAKGVEVVLDCEIKQERWQDKQSGGGRSAIKFYVRRGTYPLVIPRAENTGGQQQQNNGYQAPPPADDDMPF